MKSLLIDADYLLFKTMAACEVEAELGDEIWVRWADLGQVREAFWETIEDMRKEWPDDEFVEFVLCWTGPSAFRKRLDPAYKANRKGTVKPIGWKRIKAELLEESNSWLHDEIEADDWLGIMPSFFSDYVVVSGDKDLDQVPGAHYWPWREEKHWTVTPEDALRRFYEQVLSGDTVDNIPGCPGIGEVNAKRIVDKFNLHDETDCWQRIVSKYGEQMRKKRDWCSPLDIATIQARLVRILQPGEYDTTNRTVNLWTPPTLKLSSVQSEQG